MPTPEGFAPIAHPQDVQSQRNYVQLYTYDPVGNIARMTHKVGGVVDWARGYAYASGGNRLLATSLSGDDIDDPGTYSDEYEHDAHGNMTAMPHIPGGLTWDHDDRLQKTDHGGGGITYFVYDGAGQRVRKVHVNYAGTTSQQRLYFGSWETYREHVNIGTTNDLDLDRETLHVHDDHGRVCLIETKTVEDEDPIVTPANIARYQYTNHLGTANLELDDAAEVITYEEFNPYGTSSYRAANSAIEVSAKRYRYTGQERDEETGLAYHGARYYAPWFARWVSADPVGLRGGLDRYQYSKSNPIVLRDPSGTTASPPKVVQAEMPTYSPEDVEYEGEWRATASNASGETEWTYQRLAQNHVERWKAIRSFDSKREPGKDLPYGVEPQTVENARGTQLNLDYYSVNIDKLPSVDGKQVSEEQFLASLRDNLGQVLPDGTAFQKMTEGEGFVGDLYQFSIMGGTERFQVSLSEDVPGERWRFSTVWSSDFGVWSHPVSGTREFGLTRDDEHITFYTRGVDVTTGVLDPPGLVFAGAERTWSTMQAKLVDQVNESGGQASVGSRLSARFGFSRAEDGAPVLDEPFWGEVENRTAASLRDPDAEAKRARAAANLAAAQWMEMERNNGLYFWIHQ